MKYSFLSLLIGLLLTARGSAAIEEQHLRFGAYTVYYNALLSDQLPRQVATTHGIVRSDNRAVLSITVLEGDGMPGGEGKTVRVHVKGSAVNLNGQGRRMEFREISEPDGNIYYIAETYVSHQEVLKFSVEVTHAEVEQPLKFSFEQEFYTR